MWVSFRIHIFFLFSSRCVSVSFLRHRTSLHFVLFKRIFLFSFLFVAIECIIHYFLCGQKHTALATYLFFGWFIKIKFCANQIKREIPFHCTSDFACVFGVFRNVLFWRHTFHFCFLLALVVFCLPLFTQFSRIRLHLFMVIIFEKYASSKRINSWWHCSVCLCDVRVCNALQIYNAIARRMKNKWIENIVATKRGGWQKDDTSNKLL